MADDPALVNERKQRDKLLLAFACVCVLVAGVLIGMAMVLDPKGNPGLVAAVGIPAASVTTLAGVAVGRLSGASAPTGTDPQGELDA